MRQAACYALAGWVFFGGGIFAVGQENDANRSRLPCLAPLIWRWEKGEFPLSMGEAFFRGPYQFREFEEVPDEVAVPFPVADLRGDESAQRLFDRGVALLHGFRDWEAERAFRQVVTLAPDCAMGYWGLALANSRFPSRARLFASEAKRRSRDSAPEAEWLWVEWGAEFFEEADESGDEARRRKAVRDLETMVLESPDDVHARAFLVRQVVLNEYRGGLPIGSRLAIDRLIGGINADAPDYPMNAYRSFLWLNERPSIPANDEFRLSIPESRLFGAELELARGNPEEALRLLEWASDSEVGWLNLERKMPGESNILAEAAGRWVATLGGIGRLAEAEAIAAAASSLPRNPHLRRNLGRDEAVVDVKARVRRELMRAWIEWELWDQLLLKLHLMPPENPVGSFSDAVWNFDRTAAMAVASLQLGNREAFEKDCAGLEKAGGRLPPAMRERVAAVRYGEKLAAELKHYAAFCAGGEPKPDGYLFAGKAHLARVCLETGREEAALRLVDEDLADRPGVFGARAKACAIRVRAGNVKEAAFLMDRDFRMRAGRADPGLPLIRELNEVAAILKLPKRWFLTEAEAGAKPLPGSEWPDWEPLKASDWTLPNWKNEAVSLKRYRGKPVLLVFFLGGGCLHCVEQLTNLVPRVPEFEAAGIPIVTISTEGVERLSQTLGKEVDPEKAFPFEIVSDQPLEVFKKYGVFDEFEKRALHGTFLIDPGGRILWSELSHEPFQHPDFLLKESRRLLDLP